MATVFSAADAAWIGEEDTIPVVLRTCGKPQETSLADGFRQTRVANGRCKGLAVIDAPGDSTVVTDPLAYYVSAIETEVSVDGFEYACFVGIAIDGTADLPCLTVIVAVGDMGMAGV